MNTQPEGGLAVHEHEIKVTLARKGSIVNTASATGLVALPGAARTSSPSTVPG